ncbi:hypothetical protein LTR84_012265 [Exophiala bonariae]|uniref:Uncharacterized protein n=1 Tax=Exophiala bonariae TaxID=1690606 RepID=A0AAV9NJD5_9EURO|nr:hypothetical protein LTR84_012265 [Exophiala bonariae]
MASKQTLSMNGPTFLRGSAMLIIWGGLDQGKTNKEEEELNDWWSNEHLPERLAIDGFLRTRRFHALREGISQYLVWYEVANLEVLTSPDYMAALNSPTPGTRRFMPILASMNRSACRVLYSVSRPEFSKCKEGPTGGTIAHVVLEPPQSSEGRQQILYWIQRDGWAGLVCYPGTLALHLMEHDEAASNSGSKTKSYDGVRFQDRSEDARGRWILLVEYAETITAPFAKHQAASEALRRGIHGCGVVSGDPQYYSLICAAAE